jgi:AcrR family transcriptional regulator
MSTGLTTNTANGRSRRRRPNVRQRIVDAALELTRRDGVATLTATSIARAAGIRQPNFYAYFKNVDDCLAAAASHLVSEFQAFNQEAFQALRDTVGRGGDYAELNLRYHRELLNTLLSEPRLAELYFRHRQGSSAFARALRGLDREIVKRVQEHLWDWAVRLGLGGKHLDEISLLAELQVGNVATIVLSILDGRTTDIDRAAETLARSAEATTVATFRRLLESENAAVPSILRHGPA